MKLSIAMSDSLSVNQKAMWLAINGSAHNTAEIGRHSGYTRNQITSWIKGVHEPLKFNFDALMLAIDELAKVKPVHRIKWDDRAAELTACLEGDMSFTEMAKHMKGSYSTIQRACVRLGLVD